MVKPLKEMLDSLIDKKVYIRFNDGKVLDCLVKEVSTEYLAVNLQNSLTRQYDLEGTIVILKNIASIEKHR